MAPSIDSIQDIEDWGSVTVTEKCTGCMTCRVLSQEIFVETRPEGKSKVFTEVARDLKNKEEFEHVRKAVMACPVAAIKWVRRPNVKNLKTVHTDYPEVVEDNVYSAGFPSKTLFGAQAYLILSKQGNILIDTPDALPEYVEKIKGLGGLKYIVFTHQDHVGCHAGWKEAFPDVVRVLHQADMTPETKEFEMLLTGSEPQTLPGYPDINLVLAPGHTPGSWFIIYKDKYLFTGDSLMYSRIKGHISMDRLHTWQDWILQLKSVQLLCQYKFQRLLAGHGESHRFSSTQEAQESLEKCIDWASGQEPGYTSMSQFISWTIIRTKSKNRFLKWFADNVILPSGSRKAIPAYSDQTYSPRALLLLSVSASMLLVGATTWKLTTVNKTK